MSKSKIYQLIAVICIVTVTSCKVPKIVAPPEGKAIPKSFSQSKDTANTANINWRKFFADSTLIGLIDTALTNNFELLSTLQEIEVSQNNVLIRKGLLYPSVTVGGSLGLDKTGRFTASGAGNASTEITEGRKVPEPLTDMFFGFRSSWEADIWSKLHNSKKAAFARYLKSIEGRNFVITNLVAEIANSYYELLAYDNQLSIVRETIELQKRQLEIVKTQKDAAMSTELAVKQFEAQIFNSQSTEFDLQQRIIETENKINFLTGRFPKKIVTNQINLLSKSPMAINIGTPAQLLKNRPDIRQAELELESAKLDVKIARAEFYPSLGITGFIGYQAFNPKYLFKPIESLAFSLAGDLSAPIINRRAIKAEFNKANAYQLMALYDYQKTILNGYLEVSNEMSNINNLEKLFNSKSKEVEVLNSAIDISQDLFKSARANYLEVLIAQRDALAAKLELVEARKRQFNSITNIYKALGGGWK